MVKKKRVKKGIESLKEQIRKHEKKLAEAIARDDAGSIRYLRRELETFKKEISKRLLRSMPRKKRLKVKKKEA